VLPPSALFTVDSFPLMIVSDACTINVLLALTLALASYVIYDRNVFKIQSPGHKSRCRWRRCSLLRAVADLYKTFLISSLLIRNKLECLFVASVFHTGQYLLGMTS
jgi:hypothetical protein